MRVVCRTLIRVQITWMPGQGRGLWRPRKLPAASAVGFVLVGLQFSSAVVAVLLKRQVFDPELEQEASNVAATSLHGTGRSAGALTKALQADKAKAAKKKKKAQSIGRMSPGEAPKRLI